MVCMQYILPLLFATAVWADYYIDNANTSVVYSMAPSTQSGQAGWETFSVSTQSLELSITNSTGNYTILLDASHCYDQNYALGVCGVGDNCFVSIPFTGSGIAMYVFSAGASGMTAGFSIDGGPAVSNSTGAPPGPTFQVSNVSLYNIQGLTSGNHTMVMTVLDWNGSPTSMKFDYAYVNESLVEAPATTSSTSSMTSTSASQAPSQTSTASTSNKINIGAVVGGTLGGVVALASAVIALCYFRKRKARLQDVPSAESTFQVNPFTPDYRASPVPPLFTRLAETNQSVPPLARSGIIRNALATGFRYSSDANGSLHSGMSPAALQPICHTPSDNPESDPRMAASSGPFSNPQSVLTEDQLEVIDRLRADKVPAETIARVIEEFVTSRLSPDESAGWQGTRSEGSIVSALPPPSYQTRER